MYTLHRIHGHANDSYFMLYERSRVTRAGRRNLDTSAYLHRLFTGSTCVEIHGTQNVLSQDAAAVVQVTFCNLSAHMSGTSCSRDNIDTSPALHDGLLPISRGTEQPLSCFRRMSPSVLDHIASLVCKSVGAQLEGFRIQAPAQLLHRIYYRCYAAPFNFLLLPIK